MEETINRTIKKKNIIKQISQYDINMLYHPISAKDRKENIRDNFSHRIP